MLGIIWEINGESEPGKKENRGECLGSLNKRKLKSRESRLSVFGRFCRGMRAVRAPFKASLFSPILLLLLFYSFSELHSIYAKDYVGDVWSWSKVPEEALPLELSWITSLM